jgi:hypothetical protein
MKLSQQLIFFGIAITIYGLINFYIIRRGLSTIPSAYKTIFLISSIFVVLSYIAGRFLERIYYSFFSDILIWVGSFWVAFMFYFLLCLIIIDFARLLNHFIPFFPPIITQNYEKAKRVTAIIVCILVTVSVVGGYINTKGIVTKSYTMHIKKKAGNLKFLTIAMASDLHLGTILGKSFLEKVKNQINGLHADIILLPGDIVDEDVRAVYRKDLGDTLSLLKAKYGVFAVTGNHEYIGGVEQAVTFLTKYGIKVLRDTSVKIDNSFYIVGREDRSFRQMNGTRRKDLKEIIKDLDPSLPTIMMDHQPFALHEAEDNAIDVQLSGHTHNGQLWPLNHIINKIYELGWGYMIKGPTHYYVSCGVGGWGPPVRTGSRPEIIYIKLKFDGPPSASTKKNK